jgi:hypothetical protein
MSEKITETVAFILGGMTVISSGVVSVSVLGMLVTIIYNPLATTIFVNLFLYSTLLLVICLFIWCLALKSLQRARSLE